MTKQLGRTRLVFPPAAFSLLETRMWRWEEVYGKCLVNRSGSALLLFQHFLSLRRACPQGQDSPSGSPHRARQGLPGRHCYAERAQQGPENEAEPAGTGRVGLGFKVASSSALLLCIVWALSPQSVAEL